MCYIMDSTCYLLPKVMYYIVDSTPYSNVLLYSLDMWLCIRVVILGEGGIRGGHVPAIIYSIEQFHQDNLTSVRTLD